MRRPWRCGPHLNAPLATCPNRRSEREFQKVEYLRLVCGPCRGRDLKLLTSQQNSLAGWRFIGHAHRPLSVDGERKVPISPVRPYNPDRASSDDRMTVPQPKVRRKFHPELGEFGFKICGYLRNDVSVLIPLRRYIGRDSISIFGVLGSLGFSLKRGFRFRAFPRDHLP